MEKLNDLDPRSLINNGLRGADYHLGKTAFRLGDEPSDNDDKEDNKPGCRDDIWQEMLRKVLGHVPKGAEEAPPCDCELYHNSEEYDFAGLAGLPPAVRLMDGFFPVRNQSKRGACFAFALVALCEYMLGKKVEFSEQSLFHFTKLVTPGKVEQLTDGAFTLDAIHAVEEYGICPLAEWHYNPESWNYVEDPYNEGQGMALLRKLASAQKYRFRHWRMLSNGNVLQFKQALSAGFPVYTGVLVTTDWDDDNVFRTGVIPVPKLHWRIRVLPPPRRLVEAIMAGSGIDFQSEGADAAVMDIAGMLIQETIEYVRTAVFGCDFSIRATKEGEDGVELDVQLNKLCGGHALCLAGYVDNSAYEGGGYFIARNSWSDTEWAPESPEMPGYALIPYAYIAVYGKEGVVMTEFPEADSKQVASVPTSERGGDIPFSGIGHAGLAAGGAGAAPHSTSRGAFPQQTASCKPATMPVQADGGFDAWLEERSSVLDRPLRDKNGILLRPGSRVFVPDASHPSDVLKDTPENRGEMRKVYEKALAVKEDEQRKRDEQEAKEREARIESSVYEAIVEFFKADDCAPVSLVQLKSTLLSREPALSGVADLDCRIRAAVLALQNKDRGKIWFGRGFGGQEEIRRFGKESDRIFV